MSLTVCVFCASSDAVGPDERAVAAGLGAAIAGEGWSLVYGGGNVGLMGEVARAALDGGAHVTGVIPHRLATREIALDAVSELIRTDTMRERKAIMDSRSDCFVVLPGGIGTLEELVEILTLKQLGYHSRPVVLLDPSGFWEPLREQLRRMVYTGLAPADLGESWTDAADVPAALAAVRDHVATRHEPSADEELEAVESPAWEVVE